MSAVLIGALLTLLALLTRPVRIRPTLVLLMLAGLLTTTLLLAGLTGLLVLTLVLLFHLPMHSVCWRHGDNVLESIALQELTGS